VIEPGFIRSGFADAAVKSMQPVAAYGAYNTAVASATRDAYLTGLTAKLGGTPEDVAQMIERALAARNPRARYTVTPSARLMLALRALLPDRAWDRFLRSRFPTPDTRPNRPAPAILAL